MNFLRKNIDFLRTAGTEFLQDLPFTHSAALAYYALMSLVPLIFLSVTLFGRFMGQEKIMEIITAFLNEQVGIQDLSGITGFLSEIDFTKSSLLLRITGVVMVIFSTTAMLNSLRTSINRFYGVEPKANGAKRIILQTILSRLLSMAFVLGVTVVIILVYFGETVFLSLGDKYLEEKEMIHWIFSSFARHGIPILTNLIVFTFIFKFLHDGSVKWKIAFRGAVITSFMIYIGQLLIKYYLTNYFFASGAGVAGTFLVLLVWVYYSAMILFMGVKMTATYAKLIGQPIKARRD